MVTRTDKYGCHGNHLENRCHFKMGIFLEMSVLVQLFVAMVTMVTKISLDTEVCVNDLVLKMIKVGVNGKSVDIMSTWG